MSKASTSRKRGAKASSTDWARVDALQDQDIDLAEDPEGSIDQFARAVVRDGLEISTRKEQVTLRIDADVLAWFRARGKGYQTRINALLRAYVRANRRRT